jgi:TPP-dependent 2-oxoacid decarboxylase
MGLIRIGVLDDVSASLYHRIMRTTVTIDDDVYDAALANAQATGRRIGRVLSEMARTAIEKRQTPPSTKRRKRFASFDIPKGAPTITASKIQKALDEDGIV